MKLIAEAENRKQAERYLSHGADEVLVPLQDACFSALEGVSMDEIIAMHRDGMPVTVLMNRLVLSEDFEAMESQLRRLLEEGISVTLADPGLVRTAVRSGHGKQVIYRPETLAVSGDDVRWWMERGLQSVSISPLLTEEETLQILHSTDGAEVTLHGHTLLGVSRRKLLSLYAGQEGLQQLSFRKDLCITEEKRDGRMPVYENAYAAMVYSDHILESFAEIQGFAAAGAARGLVQTAYLEETYVCDTLHLYRALLDDHAAAEEMNAYRQKYAHLPMEEGYYHGGTIL